MSFETQVNIGIEQMEKDLNKAVRQFYLELFSLIVMRSPVGNPLNWKVNKRQAHAKEMAGLRTAFARQFAKNLTKNGRLKAGRKVHAHQVVRARYGNNTSDAGPRRHLVRRGGDQISKPHGYTGGRFRANWQVSLEAPTLGVLDSLDKSGGQAISALREVLAALDIRTSKTIHFVNNLDYAMAIEFGVQGKSPLYPVWSRQAPQGVVRVSLADAQVIWNRIFTA